MFKTYLKETLAYVIDHFAVESKRHFNLSLSLTMAATSIGVVLVFVYVLLGGYAFGYIRSLHADGIMDDLLIGGLIQKQVIIVANSVGIFVVSLYGSFIISTINDIRLIDKEQYTFKDFREFISPEEWSMCFKLFFAVLVFDFITFRSFLNMYDYFGGHNSHAFDDYSGQGQVIRGFLKWLDAVITLIKTYAPYLMGIFFIITIYGHKLSKETIRQFRPAIIVSLFLAFCTQTIGSTMVSYVDTYLIGFIRGVTPSAAFMIFPGTIKLCTYMCMAAYFNWGISASLCLPIKLHAEREEPVDEDHNAELAV